jgi:hypothetical protein
MTGSPAPKYTRGPYRRDANRTFHPSRTAEGSRLRHRRSQLGRYLDAIGGSPSPLQADIIEQLISVGWREHVLLAEAEATGNKRTRTELRRQAAELSRQLILLRRDLAKLMPSRDTPAPAQPADPLAALRDHLARHAGTDPGDEDPEEAPDND